MTRFILVSFGFMALAFYELSGGADFDPVVARDAAVLARAGTDKSLNQNDTRTIKTASVEQPDDAPKVTRMALNLTSFEDVITPKRTQTRQPILAKTAPALDEAAKIKALPATTAITATVATFDTTPDAEGVLPSIIFSGSRAQASSGAVSAQRDIRFVSAAIVNMRGGPGTGFDVVTKLNRDTEVEILLDDGTGWVKLRPVSGGPEGWIADYLLTNG